MIIYSLPFSRVVLSIQNHDGIDLGSVCYDHTSSQVIYSNRKGRIFVFQFTTGMCCVVFVYAAVVQENCYPLPCSRTQKNRSLRQYKYVFPDYRGTSLVTELLYLSSHWRRDSHKHNSIMQSQSPNVFSDQRMI